MKAVLCKRIHVMRSYALKARIQGGFLRKAFGKMLVLYLLNVSLAGAAPMQANAASGLDQQSVLSKRSKLPMLELKMADAPLTSRTEAKHTAIAIPQLSDSPRIDGELDDSAWRSAAGRTLHAKSGQYRTTFQYGYTSEGIFFGVTCHFDPSKTLSAQFRADGDPLWQDDAINVLLNPDASASSKLFWINSNGAVFTEHGKTNEVGWKHAVSLKREEGLWRAEFMIPFEAIHLSTPPADLLVNFGRSIPTIGNVSIVEPFAGLGNAVFVFANIEKNGDGDAELKPPLPVSVSLNLPRLSTVPGERWLEGRVIVEGISQELATAVVRATLFSLNGEVLGTAQQPLADSGSLQANLAEMPTSKGRIRVELLNQNQVLATDEKIVEKPVNVQTMQTGQKIPVKLDVSDKYRPSLSGVTFGVAFAPGQLWQTGPLRLVDQDGKVYSAQIEPTAEWFRDGSIKWARVDAIVGTSKELFLEYQPQAVPPKGPGLQVIKSGNGRVEVSTGGRTYRLSSEHSPIEAILTAGQMIATGKDARGLYVVDQKGRVGTPSAVGSTITIESAGPVEACIRIEGPYQTAEGEELARHITRLEFYAGSANARIYHTLVLSKDSGKVWFKEYGWELTVAPGSGETAWLGTSPKDWKTHKKIGFEKGMIRVSMLQRDHVHYMQGENRFEIAGFDEAQQRVLDLSHSEECGDWAALTGSRGGLLIGCRNAARMHPKEFSIQPGKINLLLFSPNAGMELDFKLESRARYIDLKNLVDKAAPQLSAEKAVKRFLTYKNNALGWSRTHELIISPVAPDRADVTGVADAAGALSFPVWASADPAWLCASRAMGNIHPYDSERFPEVESYVDRYVMEMDNFQEKLGEYGLLDYGSGPHFIKDINAGLPLLRRYMKSYNFKDDLWYLYARRGDRFLREFAQRTNRFFLDCYMVHWDDLRAGKRRGFYARAEGSDSDQGVSPFNLPIHWASTSEVEASGTSDLSKFLMDYYLTGYRRGRDIVEDYGSSVISHYRPHTRVWRRMRLLNEVTLAWSLDWNPALKRIAENLIERIYAPSGAVAIDPLNPYGSTYKSQSDFKLIRRVHQQLPDPRLKRILDSLADYHSYSLDLNAFEYQAPYGYVADYLYQETGDLSMGEYAAMKLRGLVETSDTKRFGIAFSSFVMNGFAYAQQVVSDTGALEQVVASYSGLDSMDCAFRWYFKHDELADDHFRYSFLKTDANLSAGASLFLYPSDESAKYGHNLHKVTLTASGKGDLHVPPDAPAGEFEIAVTEPGVHAILGRKRIPLVLNIEGFWRPMGGLPVYFSVPEGAGEARLFVEQEGMLTGPGGKEIGGGKPVKGWVELESPGLYRLLGGGMIRGENFPPFYAFGDPALHFIPKTVRDFRFQPSPLKIEDVHAYPLDKNRQLRLPLEDLVDDAEALAEGTVEFFYRPSIDAIEVSRPCTLVEIFSKAGAPFTLTYYGNLDAPGTLGRYLLYGRFPTTDQKGRIIGMRPVRPWFFQSGQWYHIAISWGNFGVDKHGRKAFTMRLFINGETGNLRISNEPNRRAALTPTRLTIGPGLPGEIAALRISGSALYTSDFDPPNPKQIIDQISESALGVMDFESGSWQKPEKIIHRTNLPSPYPQNKL